MLTNKLALERVIKKMRDDKCLGEPVNLLDIIDYLAIVGVPEASNLFIDLLSNQPPRQVVYPKVHHSE